jgi:hypothetical protein
MRPLLLYLHGFNSSSQSAKGQQVVDYVAQHQLAIDALAPTFPNLPGEAYRAVVALVERELAAGRDKIALIGSSLGGFMATVVAERFGLKAVLINPAVAPHILVQFLLGEHTNEHTGVKFELTEQHAQELLELEPASLQRPENFRVLLQTGDATLDYRQAENFYQGCEQVIEPGGSHGFDGFERQLPAALQFLELA